MEETFYKGATFAAPAQERSSEGISHEEFEEIVRLNQRRIYGVLLGMMRDGDLADTLTQECFLRAYKHRSRFRGEAKVGTWLFRIAINLARDHLRNRRLAFWKKFSGSEESALSMAEAVPDERATPERRLLAQEQLGKVWHALDELPARQREVFLLRFMEEMSVEEIAGATELRPGTVKAHLFRAMSTIRRRVKEQYEEGTV
ncbi:MAG TPA: sigma-70 family RNA polymerase sigma factor [Terriglobales bacterium]|jgi:RNA polymerase sigma-70 factor (ECF subfamily)|nr:sigma-70 family RNA polymerase sigma factor [Terriglobales bacterium]